VDLAVRGPLDGAIQGASIGCQVGGAPVGAPPRTAVAWTRDLIPYKPIAGED
jgi:hypothetical protein